jgi:hypothetical protein
MLFCTIKVLFSVSEVVTEGSCFRCGTGIARWNFGEGGSVLGILCVIGCVPELCDIAMCDMVNRERGLEVAVRMRGSAAQSRDPDSAAGELDRSGSSSPKGLWNNLSDFEVLRRG